jgi:hypothetical protein
MEPPDDPAAWSFDGRQYQVVEFHSTGRPESRGWEVSETARPGQLLEAYYDADLDRLTFWSAEGELPFALVERLVVTVRRTLPRRRLRRRHLRPVGEGVERPSR